MPGDVFKEYPFEAIAELAGASGNFWPQMSLVILAPALSSSAEGLAGVSGQQGVDVPCPWRCIECAQVDPDWRGREVSGSLGGDEAFLGVWLPFDEAASVEAWLCEHETHVEATAAGT